MALPPVDKVARLEAIFLQDGQRCENVHHFWFETIPTEANLLGLAAAYKAFWNTNLKTAVPAAVSLVMIRVTGLTNPDDPAFEYTTGLPLQGTQGNTKLPNNVTVVVKWTTAYRGRSFRGRTYHIGLANDQVSGSSLASGYSASFQTIYSNLLSLDADGATATLVVVSYYAGNALRTIPVATPVVSCTVNTALDSQRRRLPERGN